MSPFISVSYFLLIQDLWIAHEKGKNRNQGFNKLQVETVFITINHRLEGLYGRFYQKSLVVRCYLHLLFHNEVSGGDTLLTPCGVYRF